MVPPLEPPDCLFRTALNAVHKLAHVAELDVVGGATSIVTSNSRVARLGLMRIY